MHPPQAVKRNPSSGFCTRHLARRLIGYGKEEVVVELLPRATIQGVGMEGQRRWFWSTV